MREGERLKRRQKGLNDSDSSEDDDDNVTKESLLDEANALLNDIEKNQGEHKGVFQ